MKPFFILTILWIASFSAFSAEVIYRFGGTLSTNWGTLPAGSRFSGFVTYTHPQRKFGGDASSGWYKFKKLRLTVGRETINIEKGHKYLGVNFGLQPKRWFILAFTAYDPTWTLRQRPWLGRIPVGVGLQLSDRPEFAGSGGTSEYIRDTSLMGAGLKINMFNQTRLSIFDARNTSVYIEAPLTSFSGSIVR